MSLKLSILDLAPIRQGETARDSFAASVSMAQLAERLGYRRVWYAEHHNAPTIASSATAVLIAHVGACTQKIRLGAGGIMLPNHAPLAIAEQFGTLEALHPGRIDLGLGRAPGSDQMTARALRRDLMAAERFPEDVVELQGYLTGQSQVPGVEAIPGSGANVPLYILGSSLFGAKLAAVLGLPFAFASHFSPSSLRDAISLYRNDFVPSMQLDRPYVMAGVNVIAAGSTLDAQEQFHRALLNRVSSRLGRGRTVTDEEAEALLSSPAGQHIQQMVSYAAIGTPAEVHDYIAFFVRHVVADELIVAHQSPTTDARLHSVELLAESMGLAEQ